MASEVKRSGKWLSKPFKCPQTGVKKTKQFDTKELAEAYERACEEALSGPMPHLPDAASITEANTVRSLIDHTLASRYGHSPKTTRALMRRLFHDFAEHVGYDSAAPKVLTKDVALAYLATKQDKAAATRNGIRNAINALVGEAADRGILSSLFRLKAEKKVHRSDYFLSEEDEAKLYSATPTEKYRDLFRFTILTGLRLQEAMSAHPSDLQGNLLRVVGKGSKLRRVPLTKEARDLLEKYEGFRSQFHYKTVQRVIHRSAQKAGLPVSFHTFRHTTASRLAQRGASVLVIKEMLGHDSLETTQQYMHLAPGALEDAINYLE